MVTRTLLSGRDLSVNNLDTTGYVIADINNYDEIIVEMNYLNGGAGAPSIRFSTDGGSTFLSGASDYQQSVMGQNGVAASHADISACFTAGNDPVVGRVHIFNPGSDQIKTFLNTQAGGQNEFAWRLQHPTSLAVHNAMLIYSTSGTFNSGHVDVWGVSYGESRVELLNRDLSAENLATSSSITLSGIDQYDEIHTYLSGVDFSTNGTDRTILFQLSSDGGNTFSSTLGDYRASFIGTSAAVMGDRADLPLGFAGSDLNAYGRIFFADKAAANTAISVQGHGVSAWYIHNGYRTTAQVDNAMRIFSNGADAVAGRIVVYGYNY